MATVEIEDQTLARLRANAEARRLGFDAYLEKVAADDELRERQQAAIETFVAAGREATKHLPPGYEADLSRGSMYSLDRGGE